MTVFIVFLLGVFILGARPDGALLSVRRPLVLAAVATIVAASFYSARVVL